MTFLKSHSFTKKLFFHHFIISSGKISKNMTYLTSSTMKKPKVSHLSTKYSRIYMGILF